MTEATEPAHRKRRIPAAVEFVVLVAVAIGVALLIKTFFVQMFFVPSTSMSPLFVKNDRILVQKVSYWTGDVRRGDVVVFDDPGGQWLGDPVIELNPVQKALATIGLYPTGGHLVKRVIGVGGDRVVCCDSEGRVTVNGVALEEESYIKGLRPSRKKFDVTVPEGALWVMGDNRNNSEDSRFHQDLDSLGFVQVDEVVGKVWAIVWPASRITRLDRPEIFDDPALDAP